MSDVTKKILQEWDEVPKRSDVHLLPSRYGINHVVDFRLDERMPPYRATVISVHFYNGKIKYGIDVWLGNESTRLYNVDSVFVHDAMPMQATPVLDELPA